MKKNKTEYRVKISGDLTFAKAKLQKKLWFFWWTIMKTYGTDAEGVKEQAEIWCDEYSCHNEKEN